MSLLKMRAFPVITKDSLLRISIAAFDVQACYSPFSSTVNFYTAENISQLITPTTVHLNQWLKSLTYNQERVSFL